MGTSSDLNFRRCRTNILGVSMFLSVATPFPVRTVCCSGCIMTNHWLVTWPQWHWGQWTAFLKLHTPIPVVDYIHLAIILPG